MKRNIFKEIKGDLWIVLLDAVAINVAWLLGLFLRYYVNSSFLASARIFLTAYLRFAPFYTVLCILLFSEFGLYHGIWRNARFHDLGRIVGANVATFLVFIISKALFRIRIPFNVGLLSSGIQLFFVLIIRYLNRLIRAERWKIQRRKGKTRNVLVIGDDVNGKNMIKLLSTDAKYRPVVIIGKNGEGMIYNIPIIRTEDYRSTIKEHDVNCVIMVTQIMDDDKRNELEAYCQKKEIEFIDYSVSPLKLLLTIPIFTLIKMLIRGLVWEFFYEWE